MSTLLARDGTVIAFGAVLALGVALAGGLGMGERARLRVHGLEQRMGQRLEGMERRQSALHADVQYQLRGRSAASPIAIAGAQPVTAVQSQVASADAPPAAPSHPLLGDWRCAFRQQEFAYPPMACHIRRKDGGFFLEKTQGSQRIKGTITLQGEDRFVFEGLYFCPFGACDQRTRGTFVRKSRDHWVGALDKDTVDTVVTLRRPGAAAAPVAESAQKSAAPRAASTQKPKTRSGGTSVLEPFE